MKDVDWFGVVIVLFVIGFFGMSGFIAYTQKEQKVECYKAAAAVATANQKPEFSCK